MTDEQIEKDTVRAELEAAFGQVWDTTQMMNDFEVQVFSSPIVIVTRKSDKMQGSLMFKHRPRLYWGFE